MFTSPVNLGRGKQKGERVRSDHEIQPEPLSPRRLFCCSLGPCQLTLGEMYQFLQGPGPGASEQPTDSGVSFSSCFKAMPGGSTLVLLGDGAATVTGFLLLNTGPEHGASDTPPEGCCITAEGVVCEFTPHCLGVSSPGREWGPSGSENQRCLCRHLDCDTDASQAVAIISQPPCSPL